MLRIKRKYTKIWCLLWFPTVKTYVNNSSNNKCNDMYQSIRRHSFALMSAWSFYTNRSGLSCKYLITYWPYSDEAFTMPAIDTHWIMSISAFRFATSWGWGQTAWPCLINSSPSYLPPDSRSTENNRIITNTELSMHCVAKLRNRRLQTIAIFSTWERLHRDKLNVFLRT